MMLKHFKKLKSWGIKLNNLNVFQKRAQQRTDDRFSNVSPQAYPAQREDEFEAEVEEENITSEPPVNIFKKQADMNRQKQEDKLSFGDYAKDVGQQVFKKGAAGLAGAYGNILDTFGLQMKEGETTPGQQAINSIQSDILDKLNRGETPSWGELMLLSDDDIAPQIYRLPTSKEVERGIEGLTGIGEAKSAPGRIAGRGAEFLGEGAATGGGAKALLGLAASGLAGQGIREAGGPEWAATGTEIGGSLIPSLVTGKLNPLAKGAKDTVNAGRKIGLTEAQITPLIQGEGKAATLSKVASKGNRTKKAFASIKESLGDSYNTIKNNPQAKKALPNAEQLNLRKQFGDIRNELSKTLAPSPDRQAALDFIEKSLDTLRNTNVTPEYLVNFWQDINKSVKWNSINGGKKALAQLKQPISEALKKTAPHLAEDFELTNQLYSKYAQISKKLKPDIIDAFFNKGELLGAGTGALALIQGNPWILTGLAGEQSIRILAREMLINPYFQNVAGKLVNNFNSGSVNAIKTSVNQVKDYMKRKHPDVDWSFLNEEVED